MNEIEELRRILQGRDNNPFDAATAGTGSAIGVLKEMLDVLKSIDEKLPQKATYAE